MEIQDNAATAFETAGSQVDSKLCETDESQIDAKICILPSPRSEIYPVESFIKTNPSTIYYDMSKKGHAIIFNHYKFDSDVKVSKRNGTNFDTNRLRDCLAKLNFKVRVHNDFTRKQIETELYLVSNMKRSTMSCLIIVVMTHGSDGRLQAADEDYDISLLWERLTASACPELAGIPKLYFIQACRGDKLDLGYSFCDSTPFTEVENVPKRKFKIPSMADFLHMYSTYEDHSSWREADGTWFIQSLCEVLEEEAPYWELLQLLTFVNRKVAFEYQSFTSDPETNEMKQIPQIKSMLTKLLKFQTIK